MFPFCSPWPNWTILYFANLSGVAVSALAAQRVLTALGGEPQVDVIDRFKEEFGWAGGAFPVHLPQDPLNVRSAPDTAPECAIQATPISKRPAGIPAASKP